MTHTEANEHLRILLKIGQAVKVGEDLLHFEPEEIINAVHMKAGLPLLPLDIPFIAMTKKESNNFVSKRVHTVSEKLQDIFIHQSNIWAFIALLSGIQMLVLAYLTFVVYGWDVMEPVCYFIPSATALCIYAYFLYFRKQCTCGNLDRNIKDFLLDAHLKCPESGLKEWFHHVNISNKLNTISLSSTSNSCKIIANFVAHRK
ncbi:unnamed protein product [Phytomonas sp. Hart1]|nr:unnamed protein product [Phytomonas sp. Hart1]|eukprot:CCW70388.1 unnamed protein product [Phytomonas sp. isolate Hart1]